MQGCIQGGWELGANLVEQLSIHFPLLRFQNLYNHILYSIPPNPVHNLTYLISHPSVAHWSCFKERRAKSMKSGCEYILTTHIEIWMAENYNQKVSEYLKQKNRHWKWFHSQNIVFFLAITSVLLLSTFLTCHIWYEDEVSTISCDAWAGKSVKQRKTFISFYCRLVLHL